jgi:hypothetical protein
VSKAPLIATLENALGDYLGHIPPNTPCSYLRTLRVSG